ncbi:type I restriction endonuclease subunit R [Flavobacterium covae]|uniref:type I restriction endonuclease subunit R n=1 Tax=Flavobacterium covae TaxID=2906076 RepID=UPI000745D858|nr:type I restriction endonuclease [Flavobacterium covae]AMA49501.1 type I restriction endonuclease subunit R [Flavobacterium covae]AND63200.1 type I restriction endonuclease subunit R [Flavobacterium covae]MCJ1810241.1 DEAD/DEAH box helicase family protein [Flavobacterium covae]
MRNTQTKEIAFEKSIETVLLATGYKTIASSSYDKDKAIFPDTTLAFIQDTQPKTWEKLQTILGDNTGNQILYDLTKWIELHGILSTLRHGFKCYGKQLHLAYFKPSHSMNEEVLERYHKNIFGITRQLYYSNRNQNSIDVVLSVNGIPLVTLELKNQLSHQNITHAKKQYCHDRDPRELLFEFKKRTLVHFAVDTDQVEMTTRLAKDATYFLPFNKGNEGGAGNPVDLEGLSYKTAYLWKEVLQKDSLMDILGKFIHLQVEERITDEGRKLKKETMIFPRYHQLQAVRSMIATALKDNVGTNYLIEHSAGSGKSNTIAWLAHRLSSLHKADNTRLFDSVIVITDRVVLDRQLQDTIYQFEHKKGVVLKIDKDSKQLAEALENGVPIIITTLQKFPFVTEQLRKLAEERGEETTGLLKTKNYAILVDEAHSSQSGETAADLKEVLGGEALAQEAQEKAQEEEAQGLEALYRNMAKRGQQKNISFFAFTATPKHKTIKLFATNGEPLHKYTMRQAIEEGFILDVLENYTSYATFYKLIKASEEDPKVERKKAARALGRFMRLHPHNIAQKTEVMVEHFYQSTRHKIGGKAKAMVVTGSRLEAVRYKQSFDEVIKAKGYNIKSLVAFSGEVKDDKLPDTLYTEVEMNKGIKEKELPEHFATPEYSILLVADKYQTGFDQPLLHTMYVDKRLSGIQAVQTLSRLNRTHPLKEDTFVLDFVNDREEIQAAFKTYYECAVLGQEADPNNLYRIQQELLLEDIFTYNDINHFTEIYFKPKEKQSNKDHEDMNHILDIPVENFRHFLQEQEEEAELWRGKITAYKNLYAFLSQIIPYQDSDLEKLFIFLRHLSNKLPKRNTGAAYNFDDTVRLEYYRLQKISEGSISLKTPKQYQLDGPTDVATGMVREEYTPISRIVDVVNERYGTDFTQADQYFFDQIVESAIQNEDIIQAAQSNPQDKFTLMFKNVLQQLFVERIDQNEDIFARYMEEKDFNKTITELLAKEAFKKINSEK